MDFLKNKIVLAVIVLLILIILGGGSYFIFFSKKSAPQPVVQEQTIKNISPSDIGLTLTLSDNKRNVEMKITKLDGIKSIDGEFSYNTQEEDPDSGEMMTVPQGGLVSVGSVEGKDSLDQEISLGTCSSGTCRYPKILSDIKFVIKITFTDGTLGQVEQTVKYPVSTNGSNKPQIAPDEE
jgi:hypothetical protein